jgi:enolase
LGKGRCGALFEAEPDYAIDEAVTVARLILEMRQNVLARHKSDKGANSVAAELTAAIGAPYLTRESTVRSERTEKDSTGGLFCKT